VSAGRTVAVLGACGGAGGSLVAAALAVLASAGRPGVVLVDLDRGGGHAAMFATSRTRGADDLVAVGDGLSADHVRAAGYPHPSGAAVVAAPVVSGGGERARLAARLAALDDAPAMVLDLGSGPGAARAVPPGVPLLVVAGRDVSGVRAAAALLTPLADAASLRVVANEGGRRPDMSVRALARATGHPVAVELPRSDREALRLGVGIVPESRRRPLTDALAALAAEILPRGEQG
jgi:pilus assembly protein CpaE